VAANDRMKILIKLMDQGVIPIFYSPDVDTCIGIIEACARGGAKCVELTNRGPFAAQVFLEVARHFEKDDSEIILGVGSVLDPSTAAIFITNGAHFIVSPILNPDLAKLCNRRKIAYLPGCATVSEISLAEELGCEIVKLFPAASIGGPDFVKAVLGPMPWSRIMPTGGVEPTSDSLQAWFGAGAVACGMGSSLISKAMIETRDYDGISKRVAAVITLARNMIAQSSHHK